MNAQNTTTVNSITGAVDSLSSAIVTCTDYEQQLTELEASIAEEVKQKEANLHPLVAKELSVMRSYRETLQNEYKDLQSLLCYLKSSQPYKTIERLKKEKQDLIVNLEAEEEMISNQLQRKIQQLQQEKIQMEVALEQEQEAMVNRLQRQLDNLRTVIARSRLSSVDLGRSRSNSGDLVYVGGPETSSPVQDHLNAAVGLVAANSQYKALYDIAKKYVPEGLMQTFPSPPQMVANLCPVTEGFPAAG